MPTETFPCPGFWPWQWDRMCTREVPADPCQAFACTGTKKRLEDARKRFKKDCLGLQILRAIELLLIPFVEKGSAAKALAGFVIALIAGAFGAYAIAGVILLAIVFYGICYYLLKVIELTAAPIAAAMDRAKDDMQKAFLEVLAACPARCRGDMTIPECKLE